MKTFTLTVILLISQISFAQFEQEACQPEAQIIAHVTSYEKWDLYDCVVRISPKHITQYNINQTCPLDIDEVLANGISVGLVNGHDCALNVGDVISGVLVKKPTGTIVLE